MTLFIASHKGKKISFYLTSQLKLFVVVIAIIGIFNSHCTEYHSNFGQQNKSPISGRAANSLFSNTFSIIQLPEL